MIHNSRRAFLALTVAAALPAPPRAQATRPIAVGQTFLAESLDPVQGAAGWALQSHGVAEALFTTDRSGATVPNLAQSARREADGGWAVTLRPGLRFSDGSPCDAEAAAASLARALAENPRARTGLGAATRIEASDATTLRLRPERPVGALAPLLAEFPLVTHRRREDGSIVFTGPWSIREFRRGDRIVLDSNPQFRDGASPRRTAPPGSRVNSRGTPAKRRPSCGPFPTARSWSQAAPAETGRSPCAPSM